MQFDENVSLAQFTTFGIGGPARWFGEAKSERDVVAAVEFARLRELRLFVLGGGSNLLVSDSGFDGLVLKIGLLGSSVADSRLTAAAGEDWNRLVTQAVDSNLGGIECLAGIPGTVGGTPVQNVGAYGQEVSQTIVEVRALDLMRDIFVEFTAAECEFAYRRSLFNSTAPGRYIVTQVSYQLTRNAAPNISYADLKRYFKGPLAAGEPTFKEVAEAVREIRHQKGMLLVPGDPDCRSAGSFFKNPIVPQDLYQSIAGATTVPSYPAGDGFVKIPAAWLVEHAGFAKGFAVGRAGISSRHTLALINRGGASAADVIALRDGIVAAVQQNFGIHLEPEPVWVE